MGWKLARLGVGFGHVHQAGDVGVGRPVGGRLCRQRHRIICVPYPLHIGLAQRRAQAGCCQQCCLRQLQLPQGTVQVQAVSVAIRRGGLHRGRSVQKLPHGMTGWRRGRLEPRRALRRPSG